VRWPLPDDHVDDPSCTPAGLRAAYTQLVRMLAAADPDRHPAPVLADLEFHCQGWGLPSPLTEDGRAWARDQLADTPPAGSPKETGQ
jgi:hypothetical protein